jgi:hypothetical protein
MIRGPTRPTIALPPSKQSKTASRHHHTVEFHTLQIHTVHAYRQQFSPLFNKSALDCGSGGKQSHSTPFPFPPLLSLFVN